MMEGEGFEPPNPKERIYSPPRLASSLPFLNYIKLWRETESNRRHMELQSIALPTELPSQLTYKVLREQDLNLRPSGYEPDELPNCSIPRYVYKGGCGIRTHARFYTPDGFQDRSLQPDLGNPPINIIVRTGFEPVLPP